MKPILKYKLKKFTTIDIIGLIVASLIISGVFILSVKYPTKYKCPELTPNTQLFPPQCSTNGGFHTNAFAITLISLSPNTKIYYTLDGSEPSLNSNVYNKTIILQSITNEHNNLSNIPTSPRWQPPLENIFTGAVLRAITVSSDNKKSAELVRTFFIDEKGANRYSFPVIALTVNPDDFFGYKKGIYVLGENYYDKDRYVRKDIPLDLPWWEYPSNYLKRGKNAERKVHIEFYEPNGKLGFECNAGICINGNATRGFAQKSLRISFDKQFGTEILNYELFPNYTIKHFNSFILRNSGNDWSKTMFRDELMQSLMTDSKLNTQAYRPSIVFINGEYWGIHNIRERLDENYLANKYKISKDSITILELDGNLFYGKKNDSKDFEKLLTFLKTNSLSKEVNFEYLKKQIDIDNFIDFIIANIYFCNSDWPNNNVRFWRYKIKPQGNDSVNIRDGRWRWMLYDTDWGFGGSNENDYNLNLLEKATKTGSIGIIFSGLLKNKKFVAQFSSRFDYYIHNTFNPKNVIAKIDEFKKLLTPEMKEHIDRWRAIGSYEKWEEYIQQLKDFGIKRSLIQQLQLNEFVKNCNINKFK